MQAALTRLRATYPDTLRVVFKDFPLAHIHPQAHAAAQAARCAGDQNKYWEYHDVLFAHTDALEPDHLKGYATDVGLDAAEFATCLDGQTHAAAVDRDSALGAELGITGTPAFFVNGRFMSGAQSYATFVEAVEEALARR